MSFLNRLRDLLGGPTRIAGGGDDPGEVEDDLAEEMPDAAEDMDSVVRAESRARGFRWTQGQSRPNIGPFAEAEAAHDETAADEGLPGSNP